MKEKKEYGKIIINDTYYITRLDKYCLALMRKVIREKKDTKEQYEDYEIAGYHGDLSNALYQAYKEITLDKLFKGDYGLRDVLNLLQENDKEIKKIIKNIKISL